MAVYDLEEQEQISELKAWWEQYGKFVTAIAVLAALSSVGWQGYNWYLDRKANESGALYFAVQAAAGSGDAAKAREAAGILIEQFPGTVYAELGAMLAANTQVGAGEDKNARTQLEWLAANGADPVLRDIARLRVATLLLDEGAGGQALAQLSAPPVEGLRARFDDLRGDIHASMGKPGEARSAYQTALDTLLAGGAGATDMLYGVIRIKLEALEG